MKVLVHYPSTFEPPIGVWWVDVEGTLSAHYVADDLDAGFGRLTVLSKTNPECSWEDWFDQIADGGAHGYVWETMKVDSMPHDLLIALRSAAA